MIENVRIPSLHLYKPSLSLTLSLYLSVYLFWRKEQKRWMTELMESCHCWHLHRPIHIYYSISLSLKLLLGDVVSYFFTFFQFHTVEKSLKRLKLSLKRREKETEFERVLKMGDKEDGLELSLGLSLKCAGNTAVVKRSHWNELFQPIGMFTSLNPN